MKMRFSILLIFCILLTGCYGQTRIQDQTHFEGTEGVNVKMDRNNPPSELFYTGRNQTEFRVDVNVDNKGASLTKGGIFISGYDPTIIDIKEVDEDRPFFHNCFYTIDGIGYGRFAAFLQCQTIDLGILGQPGLGLSYTGAGGLTIRFDDIDIGGLLNEAFGTELFTGFGDANVDIQIGPDGWRFDIKFDTFNPDDGANGRYFMQIWEAIDFTLNQGIEFELRGDTPGFPGGEEKYISFHGTVLNLPRGMDKTRQPIMVTTCYLYSTHAAPVMCIDKDPYSATEKACRPSMYSSGRGQGSPVAITSVTPRSTGKQMIFNIEIMNVGTGKVHNPLRIMTCSPHYPLPLTEEDLNVVVVGEAYIGNVMLTCYPDEHHVRLYNGRGAINCFYDLEESFVSQAGYSSPLVLEMWYGYSETVRKDITIHRLVGPGQ